MAYYRMGELFAFRQGTYKVHFSTQGRYGLPPERTDYDPPLLFNLSVDLGERYDIAADRPDVLAAVIAAAEEHRAQMTVAEPLFDLRGATP
jgi:arylsulfatase